MRSSNFSGRLKKAGRPSGRPAFCMRLCPWYNRSMTTKKNHSDFLSQFMGDQSRARAVRTLVFNEHEVFSAGGMAKRAGIPVRTAKSVLTTLERMGLARRGSVAVESKATKGKKKTKKRATTQPVWFLNPHFPHLRPLISFVREISPLGYEEVLAALKKTGRLSVVVLSGTFMGDVSRPADIVVAGDGLSERKVETAMRSLESVFGRELRYASFPTAEFRYRLTVQDKLLRDTFDFPHRILLDRTRTL